MYLSHKYKFLFLRTPKTASSSLSEFLIKNIPDPDAIYTDVEDSKIQGTLDKAIVEKYSRNYKVFHLTLEELIAEGVMSVDQAREYTVVNVLRDPLDRQKSFYYFYKKWWSPQTPASCQEYLNWARNGTFRGEVNSTLKQTGFSKYNGESLGEYWLYENLEHEVKSFLYDLGIPVTVPMPKHKTGFRKDRNNEFQFDEESISSIKHHFKEDCEVYEQLKRSKN